jgi:non-heme chloroperoxidase
LGTVTTRDGTQLYYKDWGAGPPVVFSHGWPLNSDSWEAQMLHLASHGFRCIAHDRRGHGRSDQTWHGNDMNTFADDLAALLEALDLQRVFLVGFSMGGGEVARYIGRHGCNRLSAAALVSAVPPLMLQTAENPGGTPLKVFDELRANSLADRSELYRSLARGPFFGANRAFSKITRGAIDSFWLQGMQAGHKSAFDCIRAFSETDFTHDLASFDVRTLIVHGDDDQVVPMAAAGQSAARLVHGAEFVVYGGAPHGLAVTHRDRLNEDLLQFARG